MRPSSLTIHTYFKTLEPLQPGSLAPHSDLTFRVLDDLKIEGTNLRHSLLNGCLVRNCVFRSVNLARCDLEQVQFLNCQFVDVDFGNVELTSTQLARCRFERCLFESALITECVWRDCVLLRCSFAQSVIHNSQFEGCQLTANNLQGASIQLDTFRQCSFQEMTLGDCTFLNQVMVDCRYQQVRINAESIGAIFGLSEKDLNTFDLVYLGQPIVEVNASNGLLDALEKDYEQRRWFFMREMLRLNFGRRPPVVALDSCLEAVLWPASFGAPLKAGDITFLEMVILELFRRKELPGISVLALPERIKAFQREAKHDANSGDMLRLQQLAGRLRNLLLEMLKELEPAIEALAYGRQDQRVMARLIFARQPEADVVTFIRQSARDSGLRSVGATALLREERGSYIVVLQTSLLTLVAFQMALWLLNGCMAQMIELKSRTKIVMQKRGPLVVRERVLLPDQHIPKWMAGAIQALFAKLSGNLVGLEMTARDLDRRNLRKMEIGNPVPARRRKRSSSRKA